MPLAGKSLLDVGTGAGFPGVPLKLAVPSLRLTLLDSLQKRMRWLEDEALPALDLEARFLSGRAEEFAAQYRERFDVVTSRAVARLNLLCELCLPYVHEGGYFLAMKGAQAGEELTEAAKAIRTLGGSFERTETFEIGGAAHTVVVIRKTVNYGIKRWVDFSPVQDVLCFLMQLIADAFAVCTCGRDQEVQRLFAGVTGAFGQHIVELPVGLGM
jgi:16S rRNA (guanine(527)-N(7))-methyltransferase RsmG